MQNPDQKSEPSAISANILEKLISERLELLNIGTRYHDADIEKCRAKKQLVLYSKNLAENSLSGRGLLILGPVGVGKTCSLVVMLKTILSKYIKTETVIGFDRERFTTGQFTYPPCRFATINQIFSAIFQKNNELIEQLTRTRFLFIDDFGRGYYHDFPFSAFEELIDFRYANKLPTYITSNQTAALLSEEPKYRRVVDRWRECCTTIQISGSSMRSKKQTKKE